MAIPAAIGIDIGGTRLRAAVIGRDGSVLEARRRATAANDADELLAALLDVMNELGPTLPVGIGIAALVGPDGTVVYGPNIAIRDLPLASRLADAAGVPVFVTNDASAAALGEQRVGAAREHDHVLLVTLGTGVGGGVVIAGELLTGANGFAGEVGHVVVRAGGRRCGCGNLGCLEAYSSGSAIGAAAVEQLAASTRTSTLREFALVDGAAVSAAARSGDGLAQEIIATAGHWLGVGLASLVNVLDPEVVVVGGGASADTAPWLLPAARETLADRLIGAPRRMAPPVRLASLGDDAGVVGAGLFAMNGLAARNAIGGASVGFAAANEREER